MNIIYSWSQKETLFQNYEAIDLPIRLNQLFNFIEKKYYY